MALELLPKIALSLKCGYDMIYVYVYNIVYNNDHVIIIIIIIHNKNKNIIYNIIWNNIIINNIIIRVTIVLSAISWLIIIVVKIICDARWFN